MQRIIKFNINVIEPDSGGDRIRQEGTEKEPG